VRIAERAARVESDHEDRFKDTVESKMLDEL